MIHDLSQTNSIANTFVKELRDVSIQNDRMRFRKNLERLGNIFAYEISKTLQYEEVETETPLGTDKTMLPKDELVLAFILRAGLPLHTGLLNFFDNADSAFVSAYRQHHKDGSFDVHLQYVNTPNLEGKVLIIADPMLATGASFEKCMDALMDYGTPREIHIAAILVSSYGLDRIRRKFPDAHIWIAAEDEELTGKSYIVPGLGDAGDLAFGTKSFE